MANAGYKNPTEVEMNRYVSRVSVDNAQQRQNQALLAGELLEAMDKVACLSAEKHAKLPCVTLIMDDLEVGQTGFVSHGQVLHVKGKLTRAFGSSMEVLVDVALEDLIQGNRTNICQAFFTFVAIAKSGKAKLSHLDPVTMEERQQYALALERRKMRFAARKRAKGKGDHDATKVPQDSTSPDHTTSKSQQHTMAQTCVESIELVSPSHANHHHNTFGGQIMAWLVSVCTISASRLCHTVASIVAVNGVHFLAASNVGDRLVFKAMVNKTFADNSMEVGCKVEALTVDGTSRHINSAYLVFVDFDEHGQRKLLPKILATTADELRHQANAASRRKFQMEGEKILASVGPALAVPWSQANSSILALHNVSAFQKLCQLNNWVEVSKEAETALYKCTKDQLQCVKVEATLSISAKELFLCLSEKERAAWDPIFSESKTVQKIDNDDKIVHFVVAAVEKSAQRDDVLLLQSSRAAVSKNDGYVIAFRSITLKSLPAVAGYNRIENISSGFLIQESPKDPSTSSLIYIIQITTQISAYLHSDISGETKMYVKRIDKLRDFISKTLKH